MKEETRKELRCRWCNGEGSWRFVLENGHEDKQCTGCAGVGLDPEKMEDKITELEAKLESLQHMGDAEEDHDFEP